LATSHPVYFFSSELLQEYIKNKMEKEKISCRFSTL